MKLFIVFLHSIIIQMCWLPPEKPQSQGVVYIFSKSNIQLRIDWGVRASFSFQGKIWTNCPVQDVPCTI